MKPIRLSVASLLLFRCFLSAAEFSGVIYEAPAGWKQEISQDALAFTPPDLSSQNAVALALSPVQDLGTQSFDDWLAEQLQAEVAGGGKVLNQSEPVKETRGNLQKITIARVFQDAQGNALIQMYHAITNGRQAAISVAVAVSEEAATTQANTIRAFFASLRLQDSILATENSGTFNLIGKWTTTSFFGDIVDSTTGNFQSTAYSGEWYEFRADGTYTYTIIAGGQILSGAAIDNGTFQILNNQLVLKRKTSSWIPMPGRPSNRPAYKDRESPGENVYSIQSKQPGQFSIQSSQGMWTTFRKKQE